MLLIDKMRELVKRFRKDDPIYNCEVYINEGCSHVDGMLCNMKTCDILSDYLLNDQLDKMIRDINEP